MVRVPKAHIRWREDGRWKRKKRRGGRHYGLEALCTAAVSACGGAPDPWSAEARRRLEQVDGDPGLGVGSVNGDPLDGVTDE